MKHLTEFVNEAQMFKYTLRFMQYDPDVLAEFEDGDVTDDELHDSLQNSDQKDIVITAHKWSEAERVATKELAKIVNNHPEISACEVYGEDGEIIDTLFI